jgi:hypothetical protein
MVTVPLPGFTAPVFFKKKGFTAPVRGGCALFFSPHCGSGVPMIYPEAGTLSEHKFDNVDRSQNAGFIVEWLCLIPK